MQRPTWPPVFFAHPKNGDLACDPWQCLPCEWHKPVAFLMMGPVYSLCLRCYPFACFLLGPVMGRLECLGFVVKVSCEWREDSASNLYSILEKM